MTFVTTQTPPSLETLLDAALTARAGLFDARHEAALRLFNGFTEGWPALAVDLYGHTLLIHDYAEIPAAENLDGGGATVATARRFYQSRLPWLRAVVLKQRNAGTAEAKNGALLDGAQTDRKVREHGVWYAVDLQLNRDASLYLDTRNLRAWAMQNLRGKSLLNTFAYTGSLGVAALAGGAERVVHLDLNRAFLNVAKTSYTLNGFPVRKQDFLTGDFWPFVSRLNRADERFDCVMLDPPFFAATSKGMVDMQNNYARLINKVRPLINDGGLLVAVNNALFVSGADFMDTLRGLCADGYLRVEEIIPAPEDFTGYDTTRAMATVAAEVTDPAPFNHSTKIAVLRVRRKQ